MERDVRATARVEIPFPQVRELALADPRGVITAGDDSKAAGQFALDLHSPGQDPRALVVPLRLRPLEEPSLCTLDADLRFEPDEAGTQLALLGRYHWGWGQGFYGDGMVRHRFVRWLVSDLLDGTCRQLQARTSGT